MPTTCPRRGSEVLPSPEHSLFLCFWLSSFLFNIYPVCSPILTFYFFHAHLDCAYQHIIPPPPPVHLVCCPTPQETLQVLHSDQELQPPPVTASTSTQTSRIWGLMVLGVVPTSYPLDMGCDVGVHSWSRVVQASAISLPKGYDADQEPEKKKCPQGKSETHLLPKLDEIRDPPESPYVK